MTNTLIDNKEIFKKLISLERQIGNTGYFRADHLSSNPAVSIYAKKEWEQLSGSVKIRAAFFIIKAIINSVEFDENKILLDATSGNTGIAYALIAKELRLKLRLCIPENVTKERLTILRKLGVEIVLTSRFEGTDGAQMIASDLAKIYPEKFMYLNQYRNENNWKAHYYTTAEEIIKDVPSITHFATGLGTTGTFVGTSKRLKEWNPSIQFVAFQPDSALHGLEGWKHMETSIVPGIYDNKIPNSNLEVDTLDAYEMMQNVYKNSRLKISPSSAANLIGAVKFSEKIESGTIVTILPDNADKYSELWNQIIKN